MLHNLIYRPQLRGKVIIWHASVCLSVSPQMGGTPILPNGGTPSFPTWEYPIQDWMGVPPSGLDGGSPCQAWMGIPPTPLGLDGGTLHQNLDGVTPPPPLEWMALGQVMPRAVRLLRFPTGGLSYYNEFWPWSLTTNNFHCGKCDRVSTVRPMTQFIIKICKIMVLSLQ